MLTLLAWLWLSTPLRVWTSPKGFCTVPCTALVQAEVQRHENNRLLVLEVDGPEFHSSSFTLEGVSAPLLFSKEFPRLSEGEYEVRALVYDLYDHEWSRARTTLIVVGGELKHLKHKEKP
jgi:hypothetical protein